MKKFVSIALSAAFLLGASMTSLNTAVAQKSTPKTKVVIWHMLEPKVVNSIKSAFNGTFKKKNPNIEVVFQRQEGLGDKVTMLGQAGGNVDIIAAPHDWIGKDVNMGVVSDISKSIDKKALADIMPSALKAVKYKGKVYAVPYAVETVALIYNKKLLSTPPKTTNDLLKLAKTKTKNGKYGFLTIPNDAYFNSAWVYGYGGYYLNDANKPGLSNANTVKAFKFLQKLSKYYPRNLDSGIVNELFKKGKAAAILAGPWSMADIKTSKVDYGIAKLPIISEGNKKPTPYMGVQDVMLAKTSKNKKAALKVMSYFASQEVALSLAKSGGSIPANRKAYNDSAVKNNRNVVGFKEQAEDAIPMPNCPEISALWDPIKNALTNAVVLKEDAAKSLKEQQSNALDNIKNMR